MNVCFITGICGQDGSYLAEFLLEKNYIVYGLIRRSSSINTFRIEHIFKDPNLKLCYGDLTDGSCLFYTLNKIKTAHPEMKRLEIYNLGAQSHVKVSFEIPEYTADVDGFGTLKLLEAIRANDMIDVVRFYQASTSELYGGLSSEPLSETTPFNPRSPYAVAKLYSFYIVKNYREAYQIFACNGILMNHESCRRGHNFVTRKITIGLGKIVRGEEDHLVMGNIDALRDWGHARDYIEGMWLMLQQDKADDFVLATGYMYSVRQFIEEAFRLRGFIIRWKGEQENEIGYDEATGRELIFIHPKYYRPTEVFQLRGDATKAEQQLGWKPKIKFTELVKEMVDADA